MDEEEDDYGDIPDEDLIEALTEPSQTLPPLRTSSPWPSDDEITEEEDAPRRKNGAPEEDERPKKPKYRIHISNNDVPAARIMGATQADGLPDSSPSRIRGPIYRKPRPEPEPLSPPKAAPKAQYVAPIGKPPRPSFMRDTIAEDEAFARELQLQEQEEVRSRSSLTRISSIAEDEAFARELEEIPEGAFDSSPDTAYGSKLPILIGSSPAVSPLRQRLVAPQTGLRQTTLFGGRAHEEVTPSQAKKVFNYRVDKAPEPPTHHILNQDTLSTWIYPLNLGAIRDYQYSIVRNGLFNNLLVALPTGLGKTFIAATIMFNYYRWTKNAQIVFMAPTKPLVSQQVKACYNIVGIPRSATTMLTGEQAPVIRSEEWLSKRVFFMTPQTLINDLSTGIADPKKIVLLVVDEAHRATGDYAYVKVVQFMRRFNTSFRILALTATPGSTVEGVQAVIDGLEIAKVEIRTEESIDISQYTHRRNIDQVLLDPSDEMIMLKDLFSKALQPMVNKLCSQNGYYNKDPMSLTTFGMVKARQAWFQSDAGRKAPMPVKGMMNALFATLSSLAHSIKLLNFHGILPFYMSLKDFRENSKTSKSKSKAGVLDSPEFKKMMDMIQTWMSKDGFVGHPKLTYLCDTILNHFLDAGEGRLAEGAPPSSTRVIVFSEFRESAEDITRILNKHGPMIRASVFVGQADSKRSKGMDQTTQQEVIDKFKKGVFNVIVATSIGEEGLDIGSVDLIVCYDASGSPIRMLQRMGRTGRKRAGNIVLLLMRGKEEENFSKAKDNYEQMQKMISLGDRFNFRFDLSTRIIPKDITPIVDKIVIDIPPENSEDPESLPVPRGRPKGKKAPAKKFHMPDGVETGFRKANGKLLTDMGVTKKPRKIASIKPVDIPDLEFVFLKPGELQDLERRYLNVVGAEEEVGMPDMTAQTVSQRALLPTVKVSHGSYTERCVRLFSTLSKSQEVDDRYTEPFGKERPALSWTVPSLVEEDDKSGDLYDLLDLPSLPTPKPRKSTPAKQKRKEKQPRKRNALEPTSRNAKAAKRPRVSKAISMSMPMESDGLDSEDGPPPSSEGPGDDLAQSEVPSEDESDAGSIEDFLVRTQHTIASSSPRRSSTVHHSYVPSGLSQISGTQDSLPDLEEMFSTKRKSSLTEVLESDSDDDDSEDELAVSVGAKGRRMQVSGDDSDDEPVVAPRAKRRRKEVVDDDSDE